MFSYMLKYIYVYNLSITYKNIISLKIIQAAVSLPLTLLLVKNN